MGLAAFIVGLLLLVLVLWVAWQQGIFNSAEPFSDFYALLFETSPIMLGMDLKTWHYAIFGVALLVAGGVILMVRKERVRVVEEVTAVLECPLCRSRWQESSDKVQLKSMGYPNVRTLSRRRCAHCGKFIRPRIVTTKK